MEKAAGGQGSIKDTKTGQARTVRLLAPLGTDLAEWRELRNEPEDAALFPARSGGAWKDTDWHTWHRDAWQPACKATDISARPYDLSPQLRVIADPRRTECGRRGPPSRTLANHDARRLRPRLR